MFLPASKEVTQTASQPSVDSPAGENQRGLVYADIELVSGDDLVLHRHGFLEEDKIKRLRVSALVDSGAYMLVINERIKDQLDLAVIETQVFRLANESEIRANVVGPVEIRFENRSTTVRAAVLPGDVEVLLGSIPMEDMDVVIDPKRQRLMVNPESPYIATKHLK
ncbi:MAG TPA: aspartyl protease family protein [Pyrinomonadaceae bacterium]|nr:aspartyl protease family protein [Pyrinomonadaceae bacterium]